MTIYSLYIKTHNITGLKYLGQTIKDPFVYRGSGTYWLRHIKKHNNMVSTEVLSRCKNKEELEVCGLFFSKLFNVVDSTEWANLKPETGDGGSGPKSEETKRKMSKSNKGRKRSEATRLKMCQRPKHTRVGNTSKRSPETRALISKSSLGNKNALRSTCRSL
jgi:hypothetical protein